MKQIYVFCFLLLVAGTLYRHNGPLREPVTDGESRSLLGATVVAKGTAAGKITDADGKFSLTMPAGVNTLVVSYTGYQTQEVDVTGQSLRECRTAGGCRSAHRTGRNRLLRSGIQKTGFLCGCCRRQAVENIPMTDINQLMQGRAAGVYTTATSGQPGTQQQVRVRGTGSITAGRNPLYVVDGIIIEQGNFSALDATTNAVDVLAQFNPNDIENITILKDATAIALYGSRGSNGVVVITTKRGKAGRTLITVKAQNGVTMPNFGNFELMSRRSMELRAQGARQQHHTQEQIDATRPASMLDNTTDWLDEAFRDGKTYNVELQASGGNEKTRFFVSGGYFDQDGILIGSEFNRFSLRSKRRHTASDRLSFGLNLNGSYSQQNNAVDGNRFQSPIASAFTTTPLQGKTNPATGELYTGLENEYIGLTGDNFLYSLPLNTVDINTFRLVSKLSATYKILDNLSFTQNANIDLIGVDERVDYDDPTTADGVNDRGTLTTAYTQNRALTSQSLRYFTNFGQDHDFDVMAVYEYQRTNFKTFNAGGKGFASGKLKTLDSAAEPNFVGGNQTDYSFISYLGQVNYAFKERYRLTSSFRRDGSSRFGANNRWANFWSVGGSWQISDEGFLENADFLNNLRLRASYGTSGNADIGNFVSQELYGFGAA